MLNPPIMTAMEVTDHGLAAQHDPVTCDLSVVIPIHNEEENVEPLYTELKEVLGGMGVSHEMVFVDDGSRDRSLEKLRAITKDDPHVTIVELRRNFGQTAAMAAGFDHAGGRVIVPIDGDMQNDPRDIAKLLVKMNEGRGFDVVSGWRKDRHDAFINRKLPSIIANGLIGYVTGVKLHDYGCTLKAYRREVLRDVNLYSELHRFLPALAAWNGGRVAEIPVNHRARTHGTTKYGIGRTFRVLLDLVTVKFLGSYMNKPLYFFGKLSFYTMLLAVIVMSIAIGQKFGHFGQPEGLHLNRNILATLSVLFAILSAQCLVLGVMAELLVRIYHESQGRPTYRVRNIFRGGRTG
ncbi:MAG TPA: glycosyltransferase family 2 protein [Phycisphaerae bacterium]|nr:glycosyltransferase family 2 protein [Phycisphaerae bacterium]